MSNNVGKRFVLKSDVTIGQTAVKKGQLGIIAIDNAGNHYGKFANNVSADLKSKLMSRSTVSFSMSRRGVQNSTSHIVDTQIKRM